MRTKHVLATISAILIVILGITIFLASIRTSNSNLNQNSETSSLSSLSSISSTSSIDTSSNSTISTEIPTIATETVLSNLNKPWDMVMLDDKSFIFTEKNDKINYYDGQQITLIGSFTDTYVKGEGGMMALAIDPLFSQNNFVYACFNSIKAGRPDVRVARLKFDKSTPIFVERTDIVTGMPSIESGRHSGCQLEFGPDGYLWIGTGDAATGSTPQSVSSLGGKILRVDRDGVGATDNPGGQLDPRIFSYGHRNTQGLGFFRPESEFPAPGISIEHGSNVDDEVNPLITGNFGWDPPPSYQESGVPMTDLQKFPDAITAIWSSGNPTEATSGGTIANGNHWQAWDQAVFVAVQKNQKVIVLELNKDLSIRRETEIFKNQFGRIRTVVSGVDDNLYLLTDNGNNRDQIVKIRVK